MSAWANKWTNKTPDNYLLGGNPSNLDNSATAKAVHGATDCSGFTYWAFNKIGITLTRTSQTQWSQDVDEVKKEDAKVGDLLFFIVQSMTVLGQLIVMLGSILEMVR